MMPKYVSEFLQEDGGKPLKGLVGTLLLDVIFFPLITQNLEVPNVRWRFFNACFNMGYDIIKFGKYDKINLKMPSKRGPLELNQ